MKQPSFSWAVVKIQRKSEPDTSVLLLVKLWQRWEGTWGDGLGPGAHRSVLCKSSPLQHGAPASVGGGGRSERGAPRPGPVAPKWSPWPFCLDVTRDTKLTFSMNLCVHVEVPARSVGTVKPRFGSGRPWTARFGFSRREGRRACVPQRRLPVVL